MGAADETSLPGPADDALRIGDVERAAAAAALARHWAAGRLNSEEFEQRTAAAWDARTASVLSELFRDLPTDLAPSVQGRSGRGALARELARLATRARATSGRRLAAGAAVAALAVVGAGGGVAAGGEHEERGCRTVQVGQQDAGDRDCVTAESR